MCTGGRLPRMPRMSEPPSGRPADQAAANAATVVIHGHFYQPPRENPWTGQVGPEPSAAPFENWNERIAAECYAPLAEAGVPEWMSFDIGSTLARWLEVERPAVHDAFVEADRASRKRFGHGAAVATPYHHIILPLASRREKETEIRWGLLDFERRFGRRAEGMWLPETAVDRATLEALAAEGVAFTILAPHQAETSDHGPAPVGRVRLGRGRSIAVFLYDGRLSHGVAFGALLQGSDDWFDELLASAGGDASLIALATDGETFGHHHRGADGALAQVISNIRSSAKLRLGNFASVLAASPELPEVALREPTSWSCAHGVERWRADCGCRAAPETASQQQWRKPLRAALESLASGLDGAYAELAPGRLSSPDRALAEMGRAMGTPGGMRGLAVKSAAADQSTTADRTSRAGLGGLAAGSAAGDRPAVTDRASPAQSGAPAAERSVGGAQAEALALLEMMRDRAAMFTSCGWFFDDIAGIEALQVLGFAAHAIERLGAVAPERAADLERTFVEGLGAAPANDPQDGNGAHLYERLVRSVHFEDDGSPGAGPPPRQAGAGPSPARTGAAPETGGDPEARTGGRRE